MPRHVHADLMIAYANDDSLEIEYFSPVSNKWMKAHNPSFLPSFEYRIKPKPDVCLEISTSVWNADNKKYIPIRLKVVLEGCSGEVKSVELMK